MYVRAADTTLLLELARLTLGPVLGGVVSSVGFLPLAPFFS